MNKSEKNLIDKKLKISDDFNREVGKLIKLIDTKFANYAEVAQLKRLVKLGKSTDPLILIESCRDMLWKYKEYISEENDKFFLNSTFEQETKHAEADDRQFAETIITLFKQGYNEFSVGEKKIIWQSLKLMLKYSVEYKLACGEHM